MTASALLNLHSANQLNKNNRYQNKNSHKNNYSGKNRGKKMSASKRQGIIAIGVCCILVSVLLVFYGISQPKVNETLYLSCKDTLSQTSIKTSSSDKNDASFKNSGADTQTTVLNTKSSQTVFCSKCFLSC